MMTMHVLHSGSGYTYLTDSVATGDRKLGNGESLTNYYTESGTPPGQWHGSGVARLGVTGEVTKEQMQALFGEGMHPDADRIIAEAIDQGMSVHQAINSAKLGRLFSDNVSDADPMIREIDVKVRQFKARNGGQIGVKKQRSITEEVARKHWSKRGFHDEPTTKEVLKWASDVRRKQGRAVAGFDLVFTPQKSITSLWGVGSDSTRQAISAAHKSAVTETLAWLDENVAFSRKGYNGVVRVEGEGLIAARFDHFDNRAGDPNLHTHCAVVNKVFCPDDEKWRSLDGRAMHQLAVAASTYYNKTIKNELENSGFVFHPTSRGEGKSEVYEIAGVPAALLEEFSRRDVIEKRLGELIDRYRAVNKAEPSKRTQIKLAQQATLETRGKKQKGNSLQKMREEWSLRAQQRLGVADVQGYLDAKMNEVSQVPNLTLSTDALAQKTVDLLENRRSQWNSAHIYSAVAETLMPMRFSSAQEQRVKLEQVFETVKDRYCIVLSSRQNEDVSGLTQTRGNSLFHQSMTSRFTSPETIFREQQLLDATSLATSFVATREETQRVIDSIGSTSGFELNAGQQAMTHALVGSGAQLAVAVGPAGAGKTTAMKAVSDTWRNKGFNVIGLGPSAAAANVLGNDLDIEGQTIASVLTRDKHGLDTGISQGTMIIVDEAGMASTKDLYRLNQIAQREGAIVRLIGDPAQLSAVESGGILEVLAHKTNAPKLDEVVRFKTAGEDQASLSIRHGDAKSFDFYSAHNRIRSGSASALREGILNEWIAETSKGESSLMLATTRRDVAALNSQAQDHRIRQGEVAALPTTVTSRDGFTLHYGDIIVTRKNDSTINLVGGDEHGRRVFNGDRWTIAGLDDAGNLAVEHVDNGARATLPAAYVAQSVELGYASTVHRAQGMTVDHAHLLLTGQESRELAYVGMSRGKQTNRAWIVTEHTFDPENEHETPEEFSTREVWDRVLTRGGDNEAALSVLKEGVTTDDTTVEREHYLHLHESLVRTWARDLIEEYCSQDSRELTDGQRQRLFNAIATGLDNGLNVEATFAHHAENSAPLGVTIAAIVEDLTDGYERASLPLLPPQSIGMDAEMLDRARHLRDNIRDEQTLRVSRMAATGQMLTPTRARTLSSSMLDKQERLLQARKDAAELARKTWADVAETFNQGHAHQRLLSAHGQILDADARIERVLQRREDSLTLTGHRLFRAQEEIAILERGLPSAEHWPAVQTQAAALRRDIAHVSVAEHTTSFAAERKQAEAVADLQAINQALRTLSDERTRRTSLTDQEQAAERAHWGTGDNGMNTPKAIAPVAGNFLPTSDRLVQALLDSDQLDRISANIIDRTEYGLAHAEASLLSQVAEPTDHDEQLAELENKRAVIVEKLGVAPQGAGHRTTDAETRKRIAQAQAIEPQLKKELDAARSEYARQQRVIDQLPEIPHGIFVSKEKIRRIQAQHTVAHRRFTEAATNLERAQHSYDGLAAGLPPKETWRDLLNGTQHQDNPQQRSQLRRELEVLDHQIHQRKAKIHARRDAYPATQPAPGKPARQQTQTHHHDL